MSHCHSRLFLLYLLIGVGVLCFVLYMVGLHFDTGFLNGMVFFFGTVVSRMCCHAARPVRYQFFLVFEKMLLRMS